MKFLASLLLVVSTFSVSAQLEGTWYASFSMLGITASITMEVQKDSVEHVIMLSENDGKFTDQKMTSANVTATELSFEWKRIHLSYEGTLNTTTGNLEGIMSQRDVKWEVTFHRKVQDKIELNRPQEPDLTSPNLAFTSEEVMVKNGDVELHGELTLPKTFTKDMPIVILASGSGPQDRNCLIMGHKPFLVIAAHLAEQGIGCIRFDDRGTGESTGSYAEATLMDFSSDLRAWVSYSSKRFKKHSIGLAGHSEGGIHAMIAAKKNCKVDFIVALASVGVSGRETLIEQQYLIPKKAGDSEEACLWNQSVYRGMCDIIDSLDQKAAATPLADFLGTKYDEAPARIKEQQSKFSFMMGSAGFLNSQWGREFSAFRTEDYLPKIKVPVLVLNGSEDIQVPAISNQAGFTKHLSKKSRKRSHVQLINGVNHLFQTCVTCEVLEYADLEETFSLVALTIISNWVNGL